MIGDVSDSSPSTPGTGLLIGRFDDAATEERFRQAFYTDGRRLRLEAWTAVSVYALVVGSYFTLWGHSDVERSTIGPPFLIGMLFSICLGFLSQTVPLRRCRSATLFIVAAILQVGILMAVRIALYRAGHEPVPVTYPMALSLVLIVTQLRLVIVAPVIMACAGIIAGCEIAAMPMTVVERNTVVLGCAIALASLVSVYRVEVTSRRAFETGRRYDVLANTDGLTSIANRRHAEHRLRTAVGSPALEPVSLAILDLDDFKAFNDAHGHPAGDRHLQLVAAALADAVDPETEFVARHAGEEFTVLFTRTDPADARRRTESLRALVGTLSGATPGSGPTTASAGVATLAGGRGVVDEAVRALTRAADEVLYRAKKAGRNRTTAQSKPVPIRPSSAPTTPPVDDIVGASDLRIGCGRMRFGSDQVERQFRDDFEQQGRGSRVILAVATLAAFVVTVTVQTWLLDGLTSREQTIRFSLIACDVVGLGLAIIVARRGPRRYGPHLHIVTMALLITGLMAQRLAVPIGITLVPLLAPIAVLVSLALVQIRHELLVPSVVLLGVGMLTAEALVLPVDAEQAIAIGVGAIVIAIITRFAYAMERLQRVEWERTRLLDELSLTDLVTGLPNRRAFTAALRARLTGDAPIALLLLDVDHLKDYNDRFGHSAGDRFLASVGRTLGDALSAPDSAARIGGEEFGVLLVAEPGEEPRWAARADRIRAAIGARRPSNGTAGAVVTASAGLAIHRPSGPAVADVDVDATVDALFERADRALYQAKDRGRDLLVIAPALPARADV